MSGLRDMSADDLRAASQDLEHQIRALRERRLAIARELESRIPGEEPQNRVVSPAPDDQAVTPGFVEGESKAFAPGDDGAADEHPKRRWGRRR